MTEKVDPIRRRVTVACDPQRAFRVFTTEMETWWPPEHSRAASEHEGEGVKLEGVEFEERVGGQVLERMSNGATLPWAEVLAWEPPKRFVLAWHPHARPQPPTEVEVTFTPQGGGTLVELEHRGWERLVEDRELYESYGSGWILTLDRFVAAANDAA
jgi:uncharacterized protein YndB with AHSA1/START domain